MLTQTGGGGGIVSNPASGGHSHEVPMRAILALLLSTASAAAHPGHIADLAGHDHWVVGAGLGAIALAGLVGWLKGGKDTPEDEEHDAEPEEQAA